MKRALCIMSGGMDSTLSAYMMKDQGYELIALHFNYNQRTEQKELKAFNEISDALNIKKKYVLDLGFFENIGASALTDIDIDVPVNGIEDGIPVTYVPFRNGIFLSIAGAIAEKEGAEVISIGVVEEDSSGYPDCREDFIQSIQKSINLGTKDDTYVEIAMPLVHLKKEQIVQSSLNHNVPLELTWSCYKNEEEACGVCDSCRLRLQGFKRANIVDPITYKK